MKKPGKQPKKAPARRKQKKTIPTVENPEVTDTSAIDEVTQLWGDPKNPDLRAIEPETARVKAGLSWLAKRAHKGDKVAFHRLVTLVTHGTTAIRALTTVNFETARELAMGQTCWPVNITDSSVFPEDLNVLRKRLSIGANYPVGFNLQVRLDHKSTTGCREIVCYCLLALQAAKAFERKKTDTIRFVELTRSLASQLKAQGLSDAERRDQEVNEAACRSLANKLYREIEPLARTTADHLKHVIQILATTNSTKKEPMGVVAVLEHVAHLPELSLDSEREWFQSVKALLVALTNGIPERNPVLAKIGDYRIKKYFRDLDVPEHEIDRLLKSGRAEKSVYKNVRDGIFTKVRAMIRSLLSSATSEAVVPPSTEVY